MWTLSAVTLVWTAIQAAALMLSPCGPDKTLEVVENTTSVFTCSGAAESDAIQWGFKARTATSFSNISYCNPIQSGQTAGTCYKNNPTFNASRPTTGTSLMTVTDSPTTNNIVFEGSTLLCRRSTETDNQGDNCLMDHVALPQSKSCSVELKTDVTPWKVRASCSVTRAYSYLNRYTCRLQRTSPAPGSAARTPVVNMTTSGSGRYKSGTCDVSVVMPTVTGTYSYKVVITPGRLNVTAGTIQISQPSPSHTCPQYVAEGGDVICTCGGDSGSPPGVLRWQHDPSSTQLTLTDVKRNQNGTQYRCQAVWNGIVQQDDHVYTLNVAYGPATPTVTSSSDPLDTNGSRDLTLSCSASQVNPAPPVYSWTRASSSGVIHTGQRYTFKPQPPDHDGSVYQCHAQNSFTNAATSASVEVRLNYPPTKDPVITTSDNDLYQGDPVTLTCTVTGGKPVSATTVNFTCPGKTDSPDIPVGSTAITSNVTFHSLSATDQDKNCTCNAKWKNTDLYKGSNRTQISFYAPPSTPVISAPTGYPLIAGEGGYLTCVSATLGRPAATYTWPVGRGGNTSTDESGRGTLTFDTLSWKDHRKNVTCKASNLYTVNKGPVSNGSFTLQVFYEPVITTQPLNESNQCVLKPDGTSCEVTEGNGVYINCTSHSYPAPASTVWTKDGRKVGSGSVLSLNLANRTIHNGLYGCNVTTGNLTGHPGKGPLTKAFDLTVFVKYVPERTRLTLSDLPGNLTVTEGDSVVFACLANGRRTPSITLVKKETKTEVHSVTGGNLQLEDRDSLLNYTLTSAKCNDTGTYTCTARNDVGTGPEDSGAMFVNCTPRYAGPRPANVPSVNYVNQSAHVTFNLWALPVPDSYQLLYLGLYGNETTNITSIVFDVQFRVTGELFNISCDVTVVKMTDSNAAGYYNLTVSNTLGDTQLSFQVKYNEKSPLTEEEKSSVGAIVGGTIAGGVVITSVAAGLLVINRRRKGKTPTKSGSSWTGRKHSHKSADEEPDMVTNTLYGTTSKNDDDGSMITNSLYGSPGTSGMNVHRSEYEEVGIKGDIPLIASQETQSSNATEGSSTPYSTVNKERKSRQNKKNPDAVYSSVDRTRKTGQTSSGNAGGGKAKPAISSKPNVKPETPKEAKPTRAKEDKGKAKQKKGPVYGNMSPLSMQPMDGSVYENYAFDSDEAQNCSSVEHDATNKDGLTYTTIQFTETQQKKAQEEPPTRETTEYVSIDFTKQVPVVQD